MSPTDHAKRSTLDRLFEHASATLDLTRLSGADRFLRLMERLPDLDLSRPLPFREPRASRTGPIQHHYSGTSFDVLVVDDWAAAPLLPSFELTRGMERRAAPVVCVGVDLAYDAPAHLVRDGDWTTIQGLHLDDGWLRYRHISPRLVPAAAPEPIEQQLQRGAVALAILEPPALPPPHVPPASTKARRSREASRHIRSGRVVLPSKGHP